MDLGLAGRRAIVTGGSKGIGKAIAAELLAEGATVAICSRHAGELDTAAAELVKQIPDGSAGSVHARPCDVTDAGQVTEFVEAAAAAMGGGLDILVNNAGGARPGQFATLTDDDWHTDIDTKLLSQIRCTRAALPHLRRSTAPRIININAVYGRYPDPAFLASSVNRASCLNLAKALAIELGREGILVNSVNIGFVTTPQWENIRRRRAPGLPAEEFYAELAAAEVPLGRFGRVDVVAGLVAVLASDRASYITGASVDVAGGMGKYL
jgi:NAD(P)-dependent dehydrogenase (short-subunit alcohol dehydrogenase family)